MRKAVTLFMFAAVMAGSLWAGELSGRRAPGFSLPDLSMRQHDLADYRGKVIIVNFMRTDCTHCNAFARALAEVEAKHKDGLQLLQVVNPPADTSTTVQDFLIRNLISQLFLFDSGQVATAYLKLSPENPSFDVPHFFVIDKEGMIQEDYGYNPLSRGIFEAEVLEKIVKKYLD